MPCGAIQVCGTCNNASLSSTATHSTHPIRLPASGPNLNAYAERFVRSIQSECLSKLVLLGESHLRATVPSTSVNELAGSCASTIERPPDQPDRTLGHYEVIV
jgi:hypothetical protein